jgi:glucokinase
MNSDYEEVRALPLSKDTRMSIDAGGSTLRLVECDMAGKTLHHERFVQPRNLFTSMEQGIAKFLMDIGHRPSVAVVGAAGPIEDGRRVTLTNLVEWPQFDIEDARDNFGIQFHLFNDLVVAAASIQALKPEDLDVIREGTPEPEGPKLVATLSTGLNDALALPPSFGGLRFVAGESGHIPFAPRSADEVQYLEYVWQTGHQYASFEDVMSGKHGFRFAYQYATEALGIEPLESTREAVATCGNAIGPVVSKAALADGDAACIRAMQIIGGIMGTYLAGRAVATLATGGIYLVGSISANREEMDFFLTQSSFLERFKESGPVTEKLQRIPISRVLHPEFGILGASEIACHLPTPA